MGTTTNTGSLVSEADLEQQGFTAEQIARLKALAARYPWIELVDSVEEYNHLVFLKWCYRTGRMQA